MVMNPARSDLGEQRFPKKEVGRQNNQNDQRGWDLYSQLTFLTFLFVRILSVICDSNFNLSKEMLLIGSRNCEV